MIRTHDGSEEPVSARVYTPYLAHLTLVLMLAVRRPLRAQESKSTIDLNLPPGKRLLLAELALRGFGAARREKKLFLIVCLVREER